MRTSIDSDKIPICIGSPLSLPLLPPAAAAVNRLIALFAGQSDVVGADFTIINNRAPQNEKARPRLQIFFPICWFPRRFGRDEIARKKEKRKKEGRKDQRDREAMHARIRLPAGVQIDENNSARSVGLTAAARRGGE